MHRRIVLAFIVFSVCAMTYSTPAFASAGCSTTGTCDQGEAYAECVRFAVEESKLSTFAACREVANTGAKGQYDAFNTAGASGGSTYRTFFLKAKTCSSRNTPTTENGVTTTVNPVGGWSPGSSAEKCFGGCSMIGSTEVQQHGGFKHARLTNRLYDGGTCSRTSSGQPGDDSVTPLVPPPDPPVKQPDTCKPAGAGQTACLKSNGDHCATASTGAEFCWKADQTGEQVTLPNAQVKRPRDETVTPPSTQIPADKEWNRTGGHVSFTNSNGVTTVYNVSNFNLVPVGTGNAGGDGKPEVAFDGIPSTGDSDKPNPNTSTGGGDCETAPTGTGDAILANVLTQTWKTRCALEDNKSNGAAECDLEATCAGEEILCTIAAEGRKQRCAREALDTQNTNDRNSIIAQGDGLDGVTVEGAFHTFGEGQSINENLIGGGNTASCPAVWTIGGQPLEFEPQWWNVVALIKFMLAAMAYLWIARQLGR